MGSVLPIAAGLAALTLSATARAAAATLTLSDLEALAAKSARDRGVDVVLLQATIDTESSWDPDAYNGSPGDAGRGGAWGLTQLTVTTATSLDAAYGGVWRRLDGTRSPRSLLVPAVNLELASWLLLDTLSRTRAFGDRPGTETEAADVASIWNSGSPFSAAPTSTREEHVPRFLRHWRSRKAAQLARAA